MGEFAEGAAKPAEAPKAPADTKKSDDQSAIDKGVKGLK